MPPEKIQVIGFNILRFAASISVLVGHSFTLYGMKNHLPISLETIAVNVFFLISGYFIYNSALNRKLTDYAQSRLLRILPALTINVIFCIIIGALFTELSLYNYLKSNTVRFFAMNTIFYINFYLAGVFIHNPFTGVVNGSLWTLPIEIFCYMIIIPFAISRKFIVQALSILFMIIVSYEISFTLEESQSDVIIYASSTKYTAKLCTVFFCGSL